MKVCLHCGEKLGMLRHLRSDFCSKAHEQAEQDRMQRLMVAKIQQSASRFRSKLLAANPGEEDLSEIYHRRYVQLMARLNQSPTSRSSKPASEERALVTQA